MKVRQHRGGLAESMATQVEIESTREALWQYILKAWSQLSAGDWFKTELLSIEFYDHDERIGQDVYHVKLKGLGLVAITDSLPEDWNNAAVEMLGLGARAPVGSNMPRNIAAYTEAGDFSYPAYLSINERTDGVIAVTARERGHQGNKTVTFEMSKQDLERFFEDGLRRLRPL